MEVSMAIVRSYSREEVKFFVNIHLKYFRFELGVF